MLGCVAAAARSFLPRLDHNILDCRLISAPRFEIALGCTVNGCALPRGHFVCLRSSRCIQDARKIRIKICMIQVKLVHESVQACGISQGLLLVMLPIAADPLVVLEQGTWSSACGLPRPITVVVRGRTGRVWLSPLTRVPLVAIATVLSSDVISCPSGTDRK